MNRLMGAMLTGCVLLGSIAAEADEDGKDSKEKRRTQAESSAKVAASDERASGDRKAEIRQAIERGLPIVQRAARNYPNHRKCYSCHHQTLPMLAMKAVRDAGLVIDEELFQSQLEFTERSFQDRIDGLKEGTGIGGRSMTVGYGLWTREIADAPADELGAAMVTYLLKHQLEDGAWRAPSNRPPLEESLVTCTILAAYGLEKYADEAQRDDARQAVDRARKWLAEAKLTSQEDKAMKLWGVHLLGGDEQKLQAARAEVLAAQRDDGGWGQLDDMPSDAYATGQAVFLLLETGLPPSAEAIGRGIDFLLKIQHDDGSWLVETRSKPVQVYFDNGDPHGKNQFISIAASSWAVAALAAAIERPE
jgi:N-acyl-D-amino-acid deacylase